MVTEIGIARGFCRLKRFWFFFPSFSDMPATFPAALLKKAQRKAERRTAAKETKYRGKAPVKSIVRKTLNEAKRNFVEESKRQKSKHDEETERKLQKLRRDANVFELSNQLSQQHLRTTRAENCHLRIVISELRADVEKLKANVQKKRPLLGFSGKPCLSGHSEVVGQTASRRCQEST